MNIETKKLYGCCELTQELDNNIKQTITVQKFGITANCIYYKNSPIIDDITLRSEIGYLKRYEV